MELVRESSFQDVWAQAAEATGLRQYAPRDNSLNNSAEFFNHLDETLQCENYTFRQFFWMSNFQRMTGVQSAFEFINGSDDEVELMFVYFDGGSMCACKTSSERGHDIFFRALRCDNLVRPRVVVPLKVRDCKCAAHATVQLARAVFGMHDARSTVLEISLSSTVMSWIRERMSRSGFRLLILNLLRDRLKWHLYPKNPFTLLDCSFQSAIRKG